jgi:hypothetical protein
MSFSRSHTLTLIFALLALALIPASAQARTGVRVGIGDQQTAMFDNPLFTAAKFKRVRYFIPWNAMDKADQRAAAEAYVRRARAAKVSVFLHISTDDLRIKKGKLPSVSAYRSKVGRLVRNFRKLGVKEFGVWNEANHASQPTYRSPKRAASYFKVMYRLVKPRCKSCTIVALDVLDQTGVERYMRSWYRAVGSTYRRRATVVGIHNYGDVNRKRTKFTRNIIRQSRKYNKRTKFWFTETGGLVNFGKNFPCSESRAASRLKGMFSLAKRYRKSGVQRLYIYNFTGAGCQARFDAGLTNPDGSARKGYRVVRSALKNFLR